MFEVITENLVDCISEHELGNFDEPFASVNPYHRPNRYITPENALKACAISLAIGCFVGLFLGFII